MKNTITVLLVLITFMTVGYTQTSINFFLNNVNSVVHNYSTAYIANSSNDTSIKYSIVVSATGGNVSATFIMYFGANAKDAELSTISANVYTVTSWHKLEEYNDLSNILKEKDTVGIGYYSAFGSFPNRVQLTKTLN